MKQSRIPAFVALACLLAGCGAPGSSASLTTSPVVKKPAAGSTQVSVTPSNGQSLQGSEKQTTSGTADESGTTGYNSSHVGNNNLVSNQNEPEDYVPPINVTINLPEGYGTSAPTTAPTATPSPYATSTPYPTPTPSATASPKGCKATVSGGGSFLLMDANRDVSMGFNASDDGFGNTQGELNILMKDFDMNEDRPFKSAKITSIDCNQFGTMTMQGRLMGGAAFTLVVIFTPGTGKATRMVFIANGQKEFDEQLDPSSFSGSALVNVNRQGCD